MRTWYQIAAHFFAGVITAISAPFVPWLSVILFLSFIFYELDEDLHLKDGAFIDMREYAIGAFITALAITLAYLRTF